MQVHWRSLVVLMVSFLAGVLFALGHHLFYDSLAGTKVQSIGFAPFAISRQKINLAIGNILATLTHCCLALPVEFAYFQLLWKFVRGKDAVKMPTLDTLFSALTDRSTIWKISHWVTYPALAVLAIVFWTLSIPTIITPTTLSVELVPGIPRHESLHVPKIDFTSLNFAKVPLSDYAGHYFDYVGPTDLINNIVLASTGTSEILPIKPPKTNVTWSLQFAGPSITCAYSPFSFREAVSKNLYDATWKHDHGCFACNYTFLSWADSVYGSLPFLTNKGLLNMMWATQYQAMALSQSVRSDSKLLPIETAVSVARIYVAVSRPYEPAKYEGHLLHRIDHFTVVQCDLTNSTYQVNFSYIDGRQKITTKTEQPYNRVTPIVEARVPRKDIPTLSRGLNRTQIEEPILNLTVPRTWAYQSVFHAFANLFLGNITMAMDVASPNSDLYTFNSNVMMTPLAQTPELRFLSERPEYRIGSFQDYASEYLKGSYNNKETTQKPQGGMSMARTLEDLFRNITISLMSSSLLQPNYSSSYDPPKLENVTIHGVESIYVYSPHILWIGYGITIAISFISLMTSMAVLITEGLTFSNQFSSIFRAVKHSELSSEVREEDGDARDPLPKYLRDSYVTFPRRRIRLKSMKDAESIDALQAEDSSEHVEDLCELTDAPTSQRTASPVSPVGETHA